MIFLIGVEIKLSTFEFVKDLENNVHGKLFLDFRAWLLSIQNLFTPTHNGETSNVE